MAKNIAVIAVTTIVKNIAVTTIVKNIAVTMIAVTMIAIEVSIHEMTNKMEGAVGSKLIFKK